METLKKHKLWAGVIFFIVFCIVIVVLYSASQPFIIRFEMDNNTLEAIKHINYSALPK